MSADGSPSFTSIRGTADTFHEEPWEYNPHHWVLARQEGFTHSMTEPLTALEFQKEISIRQDFVILFTRWRELSPKILFFITDLGV